MKQLFKKTGNNNFQLLTENTVTQPKTNEVIQLNNGLKKVFMEEGITEVSYNKVQNMGFGFISDIHAAKAIALEEARILSEECGYLDDVDNKKFVKTEHFPLPTKTNEPNETDLSNPEEKREVQIGKELSELAARNGASGGTGNNAWDKVNTLAHELIQMHGSK